MIVAGVLAILSFVAAVIRRTAAAQCWTTTVIFLVVDLTAVLDLCQPSLDILELRRIQLVLRLGRKQGRDLLLRVGHAIRSLRMGLERLGQTSGFLLFLGFHFLEE